MAASFTDNGDGTVTDSSTGLMWQQSHSRTTWQDALSYCEGLSLAGYSDWRLPDVKELESIADDTKYYAIDTTFFPSAIADNYWSATTYGWDTGQAFIVNFRYGNVSYFIKTMLSYVRCVR